LAVYAINFAGEGVRTVRNVTRMWGIKGCSGIIVTGRTDPDDLDPVQKSVRNRVRLVADPVHADHAYGVPVLLNKVNHFSMLFTAKQHAGSFWMLNFSFRYRGSPIYNYQK